MNSESVAKWKRNNLPVEWRIWDGDVDPSEFKVDDLEFTPFPKNKMRHKLVRCNFRDEYIRVPVPTFKVNLGLADANRLLDNQEAIPVAWSPMSIIFARTLLRDPIDDLYVVGIDFDSYGDKQWHIYYCKVGKLGDKRYNILNGDQESE